MSKGRRKDQIHQCASQIPVQVISLTQIRVLSLDPSSTIVIPFITKLSMDFLRKPCSIFILALFAEKPALAQTLTNNFHQPYGRAN